MNNRHRSAHSFLPSLSSLHVAHSTQSPHGHHPSHLNLYEPMLFPLLSKIAVELCRIISAVYIACIRPGTATRPRVLSLFSVVQFSHLHSAPFNHPLTLFSEALTVSLSSSTIFPQVEPPHCVYAERVLAPKHHPVATVDEGTAPTTRKCNPSW